MSTSKRVYIAESAFFAFIDRAHEKHEQAIAFFRFFSEEQYQLFTDFFAINHVYQTIYKDISPSLGKDFLRTMFLSDINIIYPEESDIKAAMKVLITYRSTELAFEEALLAAVCNKRGIQQICTFKYLHSLFGQQAFYLPM